MNTWQIFFKSKSITFLFSDLFSNSVVYSLNKLNIRFIWSWGMRPEGISFDSGPNQGNWHANLKHVNIQYFLIWLKKYIKLAGTNIQNWLLFGLFFFQELEVDKERLIRAMLRFPACILTGACRPLGVWEIFSVPKTCLEYEFEKKTQVHQSAALLYDAEHIHPPSHVSGCVFGPGSIHLHVPAFLLTPTDDNDDRIFVL